MTGHWQKFYGAKNCHVCGENLVKNLFLDSLPIWENDSYLSQSHKKCFFKKSPQNKNLSIKSIKEQSDKEKAKNQENCTFCQKPLLQKNYRDAEILGCHLTGNFIGAARSVCKQKMRIDHKKVPIAVVLHNLKGYDAHHLMHRSKHGKIHYVFSGCLRFIDSLNSPKGSLDSLVKATPKEALKITSKLSKGTELLFKKGIYP